MKVLLRSTYSTPTPTSSLLERPAKGCSSWICPSWDTIAEFCWFERVAEDSVVITVKPARNYYISCSVSYYSSKRCSSSSLRAGIKNDAPKNILYLKECSSITVIELGPLPDNIYRTSFFAYPLSTVIVTPDNLCAPHSSSPTFRKS